MKMLALILLATSYLLLATSVYADGSAGSVCTPVYGMANSCAEHAVVDTGLETDLFSSLAIGSYLSGLIAFIKAKRA